MKILKKIKKEYTNGYRQALKDYRDREEHARLELDRIRFEEREKWELERESH